MCRAERRRCLQLALGSAGLFLGRRPAAARDMAEIERERAQQRMQTCSAANAPGAGLQAEFFAAPGFQGAVLARRVDGPLELLPADWPAGAVRSARWRGWVRPPLPGRYAFHASLPQARLVVARQEFRPGGTEQLEMAAGRYYPVLLEVARLDGPPPPLRLEWTAPHGLRYLVPRALLYLPT